MKSLLFTSLGLTSGAVTTAEVFDAMPDFSTCIVGSSAITDAPATDTFIEIMRVSANRGYAIATAKTSGTWKMYVVSGTLSGTWIKQATESDDNKVIVNGVKTNLKVYTKFISQTVSVKAGNSIQFSVNISGYGLSMLTYVTVSTGQRGIRIEPDVNSSNASKLVFTVLNIADTDYDGVIYPYILIIGY